MSRHIIYKEDKWNMMIAEVKGTRIEVNEISTQWGEETYIFYSRPQMMKWVEERFRPKDFVGQEDRYQQIIEVFRNI